MRKSNSSMLSDSHHYLNSDCDNKNNKGNSNKNERRENFHLKGSETGRSTMGSTIANSNSNNSNNCMISTQGDGAVSENNYSTLNSQLNCNSTQDLISLYLLICKNTEKTKQNVQDPLSNILNTNSIKKVAKSETGKDKVDDLINKIPEKGLLTEVANLYLLKLFENPDIKNIFNEVINKYIKEAIEKSTNFEINENITNEISEYLEGRSRMEEQSINRENQNIESETNDKCTELNRNDFIIKPNNTTIIHKEITCEHKDKPHYAKVKFDIF